MLQIVYVILIEVNTNINISNIAYYCLFFRLELCGDPFHEKSRKASITIKGLNSRVTTYRKSHQKHIILLLSDY